MCADRSPGRTRHRGDPKPAQLCPPPSATPARAGAGLGSGRHGGSLGGADPRSSTGLGSPQTCPLVPVRPHRRQRQCPRCSGVSGSGSRAHSGVCGRGKPTIKGKKAKLEAGWALALQASPRAQPLGGEGATSTTHRGCRSPRAGLPWGQSQGKRDLQGAEPCQHAGDNSDLHGGGGAGGSRRCPGPEASAEPRPPPRPLSELRRGQRLRDGRRNAARC